MDMKVYSIDGKELSDIELPEQFQESYHPNLIRRAVLAWQSSQRQPYGSFPEAGKRASVRISKRRRDYRTSYGHGISRTPRKVTWHRGRQFGWVGAFSPNTRKGRRAHPPKSEKIWQQKINKQEWNKAIRSALAATISASIVKSRNHHLPQYYPLCLESRFETLQKTKEVLAILEKLGLAAELSRTSLKKIRAGRGKNRARPYHKKTGPLIVVGSSCQLQKSAANIPGIDVAEVHNLHPEILAPGTHAGRLTIYTQPALERMHKEKLYLRTGK